MLILYNFTQTQKYFALALLVLLVTNIMSGLVEGDPFDDDDEQQPSDRLRAFGVYRQHAADPTCDNQPLPASRNTNYILPKERYLGWIWLGSVLSCVHPA